MVICLTSKIKSVQTFTYESYLDVIGSLTDNGWPQSASNNADPEADLGDESYFKIQNFKRASMAQVSPWLPYKPTLDSLFAWKAHGALNFVIENISPGLESVHLCHFYFGWIRCPSPPSTRRRPSAPFWFPIALEDLKLFFPFLQNAKIWYEFFHFYFRMICYCYWSDSAAEKLVSAPSQLWAYRSIDGRGWESLLRISKQRQSFNFQNSKTFNERIRRIFQRNII